MESSSEDRKYHAAIYIRLSKESIDKQESNRIENQRGLIHSFLKTKPEIEVYSEYVDDGFSGVSFERPAIKRLFADIGMGKVNCIVVKDLSRFGRNYIEVGRYLEQIFPALNVRFLAINDGVDSIQTKNLLDTMSIPLKNLLNDAYSRDISMKVRSQIKVRCMKGEYIGAFPVYGYLRSKENKHKLEIDAFAAMTVRDIFRWKIEGYSSTWIADHLNAVGMLSPLEYKRRQGALFYTSFQQKSVAKWSAQEINRILKNEIYTGKMVQGKESSPNYKIKKKFLKPKSEWIVAEHTHQAIIPEYEFELVSRLIAFHIRIPPNQKECYLFSGGLECGICHSNMIRKPIISNDKRYSYYICKTYKKDPLQCSQSHRIGERELTDCVHSMLKLQMLVFCIKKEKEESLELKEIKTNKINLQIQKKQEDYRDYQRMLLELRKDYQTGILQAEEYQYIKGVYETICRESLEAIKVLEQDLLKQEEEKNLKKEQTMKIMNRFALMMLIERIVVVDKRRIQIQFRFRDEFQEVSSKRGSDNHDKRG